MSYTVSYSASSLYAKTPIVGRFLDFYVPIVIPPDPTDSLYVITRQDWIGRPDNIAQDYYGNAMLFWVIGVRNGLKDLVFDIQYGIPLYFPTGTRLSTLGIGGAVL